MDTAMSRTTDDDVRAEMRRFIQTGETIQQIAAGARISNVDALQKFFEQCTALDSTDRVKLVDYLYGW